MSPAPWLPIHSHSVWPAPGKGSLLLAPRQSHKGSCGPRANQDLVHLKSNTTTTARQCCFQLGQFSGLGFQTTMGAVGPSMQ